MLGFFEDKFIANIPLNVTVKLLENRSIFGEVMDESLVSCFFLTQDIIIILSSYSLVLINKRTKMHNKCLVNIHQLLEKSIFL